MAENADVWSSEGRQNLWGSVPTVDALGPHEKVSVVGVHLDRPFSACHFFAALPSTVRQIAVLDRTKEPGAVGEPLSCRT